MSVTDLPTRPETSDPAPPRSARAAGSAWARLALAVAVLAGSGLLRAWQRQRIDRDLRAGLRSPVRLEAIPAALGDWRGEPYEIDPRIARATGADQVVTRRYVNQTTGVAVDAILLFGPASAMFLHAPEVCYPAAGFAPSAGPEVKAIPAGSGGARVPFRALVYAKGEGVRAELQEVYYTWRYNGRWSPDVGKPKQFERVSGMYKVQVARPVSDRERRDVDNPSESFLEALTPELERRLAAAATPHTD
jgi:EpsI family protein